MREDPAITARGRKFRQQVRVEVHLKDGTKLEHGRELSRAKSQFAGEGEVVRKFENLAGHALPKAQVEELCDTVLNIEKLDDAAKLAQLLAGR